MGAKRLCITCPVCGKMMCKANLLAQIEARCPSCKSDLQAEVTPEQKVTVQVIKEGNTSIGA